MEWEKKQHLRAGLHFHLSPYTLVLCGDSHFSTKEQDACSCSLVPEKLRDSQAEETILQMFNLFLLYPRRSRPTADFAPYQGNSEFLLSFLLIYLPFPLMLKWIHELFGIQLLTCYRISTLRISLMSVLLYPLTPQMSIYAAWHSYLFILKLCNDEIPHSF